MVEVHLVRLATSTAIGAGDTAEITKKLHHARLAYANALQLQIAIPSVVLDVIRTLTWSPAHGSE